MFATILRGPLSGHTGTVIWENARYLLVRAHAGDIYVTRSNATILKGSRA